MAKISGRGVKLYAGGFDISGDASALQGINQSQAMLEVPNFDKDAMERIGGLLDGAIQVAGWFNASDLETPDNAGQLQSLIASGKLRTADVPVMVPMGTALGDPVAMLIAKVAKHDVNRQPGNAVAATWDYQCNDFGIEWGVMLTAGKRTDAAATNGTSIDAGAASGSLGASAQCQVFSVASGTVEPVAQDSADDSSFAAITGLEFTGVGTSDFPTAERLETSATLQIRRYRRAATTGTFTDAVIAMGINVR